MKIDSANSSNHFDKTSHSVTFKSNPTSYVKIAMSRPPLLKKNFIQEKVLPIIEKTRELSEQIVLERATITGHFRIIGQVIKYFFY